MPSHGPNSHSNCLLNISKKVEWGRVQVVHVAYVGTTANQNSNCDHTPATQDTSLTRTLVQYDTIGLLRPASSQVTLATSTISLNLRDVCKGENGNLFRNIY